METIWKIISMLISVFTIFSSLFGWFRNGYEPIDADNLKMSAVLISDTHISTKTTDAQNTLERGVKDMAKSKVEANMLMITGDLTDNGLTDQYDALFKIINQKAAAKKTVCVMGNHDAWSVGYFDNFRTKYNLGTLSDISTPYYKYSTEGYTVFALGTEKGYQESAAYQNEAYLSDAQLNWLDSQLAATFALSDKPAFVLCHQPINGMNRQAEAWSLGGLGAQSEQLLTILKKHADAGHTVIICSGHLHNSIGYAGVTNQGNLWFVDVPSFGVQPSRGDNRTTGTGYVVECYPGKVILRARDFTGAQFMDGYQYTITTTEKVAPPTPEQPTEPVTKPEEPTSEPVTAPPLID